METGFFQSLNYERLEEAKKEFEISSAATAVGTSTEIYKKRMNIRDEYEKLLDRYGEFIPTSGKIYIQGALFSANSVLEFQKAFLYVMKHSYPFFDKKGNLVEVNDKYFWILKKISKYNKEWERSFIAHHAIELERIKRVRKGRPIRPSQ